MSKYKTISRVIKASCPNCSGLSILATKNGAKKCPDCENGLVDKIINEVVHIEEEEDARQNK